MKSVSLAHVGKIVTGKTPKTNVSEFFEGHTPFVTPSDMDGQRFIEQTGRSLSDAGVATIRNCVIPRLSVLVSCIGSDMGKTHLSASCCVTNQQINSIVVNSLSLILYLFTTTFLVADKNCGEWLQELRNLFLIRLNLGK